MVCILFLGVAGAYTAIAMYYRTHFFEHVTINGIDVSDLTEDEAEALIADQAEDYRVTVVTRGGSRETVEGRDMGYRFVSGGEVGEILEQQNIWMWPAACLGRGSRYTMDASMTYDEAKLKTAVEKLACMQPEQVTMPQDAMITRQGDGRYVIIPEVEGNLLNEEKTISLLKTAIASGESQVDLTEGDCYEKPAVRADDGALQAEAAVRNRYSSITVTYDMGGGVTEILDQDTIASWFSLDENRQPAFDREAVAAWVNGLADQYDTIGRYLPFITTNGETVYPESRTYGWQMDRETETEELYQILLKGDSCSRSPVWLEGAASRGNNDIGNTYVEIDYTNQRMLFYKDGRLLVETPVVTGNVSAGRSSPEGVFCLVDKQQGATLVGEDYKTPVDYWMPFCGGVGIHDADSWRTAYGGDIYQWGGSHGCINTPTANAAIIYENIEIGTPIICYSSGINYGYGQTEISGGMNNQGQDDVVIVDGGADGGDADGSGAGGSSDGSAEFPITIEDEWADESAYYQDVVIY